MAEDKYLETARKLFGESIKMAMEERKIGINQLSELSGVNKQQLYKVLNGEKFHIDTYLRLARPLKIHIEFSAMSAENNIHTMGNEKTIHPN